MELNKGDNIKKEIDNRKLLTDEIENLNENNRMYYIIYEDRYCLEHSYLSHSNFVRRKILSIYFNQELKAVYRVIRTHRRVAPYTPTRSCVHIGVLKKKNKEQKK